MIVADRRELETSVRQRALQIQSEELKVFADNMQTLGTQSAFLAGLGWGALTLDYEANPDDDIARLSLIHISEPTRRS
eukprot:4103058-Prymnesium_polylepis.1